jgi:hypothetical protein
LSGVRDAACRPNDFSGLPKVNVAFRHPEIVLRKAEDAFGNPCDAFVRVESRFRQAELLQWNENSRFRWIKFHQRNGFSGFR